MTKCSVWTTSVQICEAHVPFCSEVLHCFNIFTYTDSFNVTRPYNRTARPLLLSPYPYSPSPPHPRYLPAKAVLRYCHVRHGSVLSLCVLLKLPWFPVGKNSLR